VTFSNENEISSVLPFRLGLFCWGGNLLSAEVKKLSFFQRGALKKLCFFPTPDVKEYVFFCVMVEGRFEVAQCA